MHKNKIAIIIPVLNEAPSIGRVILAIPRLFRNTVIVVNSGSTDETRSTALKFGAILINNRIPTYDHACYAGAKSAGDADILVFLHGGGDDDPRDIPSLVEPLTDGRADMVMGSRTVGRNRENLLWHQFMGTKCLISLINFLFLTDFTDIGPFRAITASAYQKLHMQPVGFSWTTQMLVKSLALKLKVIEVRVACLKRIGKPKISGSIKYSLWAFKDMLWSFRFVLH